MTVLYYYNRIMLLDRIILLWPYYITMAVLYYYNRIILLWP